MFTAGGRRMPVGQKLFGRKGFTCHLSEDNLDPPPLTPLFSNYVTILS